MKKELLEKYIFDARANKVPDVQIRQELVIGGWDPVEIDAALKTAAVNVARTQKKIDVALEVPHPVFSSHFLTFLVILLIVFNLITYSGWIVGSETAAPVTSGELLGGVIFSIIGALVLATVLTAFHKIRRSHPIFFSSSMIFFGLLLITTLLITYSGAITGNPEAAPVGALDVVGSFVLSVIGANILSGLYILARRIVLHFKK